MPRATWWDGGRVRSFTVIARFDVELPVFIQVFQAVLDNRRLSSVPTFLGARQYLLQ